MNDPEEIQGTMNRTDALEPEQSGPAANNDVLSFPAALAQEVFAFLDQLETGNPAFNVAVRFHLKGPLDIKILKRTFDEMVKRHEILRTRMQEENGELMQVVLPSDEVLLEIIDISHLPEPQRKTETERQGTLEAQKRFNFTGGPLLRSNVVRLGPQEHMLQVTIHHAISDGWSIGLITEELSTIYQAFAENKPSPLPPLPIQFADFTLWQRDYLNGPEIAAQLEYWKKRLAGYTELNIPTDRPRPAVKSWSGDIVSIQLPTDLTDKLQRIGQDNDCTLFIVFLTAFNIMLMRYSGQTDISIGAPIAGRTRAEIEKLIGVFINTVILRTDLSGNPSFIDALRSVREIVLEAMANQDLPYEILVKEIQPTRDLNRNPLVQVNFTHQRDFVKPVEFAGITLTAIPSRSPGAIFDLHFFMVERDGVWRASCDYSSDIYDRETALRMLGHFRNIMEGIASAPTTKVGEFELLSSAERTQILTEWNGTTRDFPKEKTVHKLIEEQAIRFPEKYAVRCGNEALTYAELDTAANQVARRLEKLGVRSGMLIGLFLERSLQMVIGVLGILKAGASYVPMDPAFPSERLRFMVEDAQMPVIVTQRSLMSILPAHQAQVLDIDTCLLDGNQVSYTTKGRAEDLAYVIFTSGSTGRPKGVQITHRAVVNFLKSMQREPGCASDDVLLSVTTLSFDIAALELFLPLTTGATVVIATREITSNAQLLIEEMARSKTTIMQATPVTWRMLIEDGWKGTPALKILVGGESVPRDLVNELIPRSGSVWNMYGPTETTIWSAVGRLEAGGGAVRIGRPIDNTQIYIVSAEMQLQPINVAGELLIGGAGLANGYLKRPELTDEKFIPDPFSENSGAKVYRTGDLARWHANGTLECLGRIDHQVKIRGFRIELGEIESILAQYEGVRQCVVLAREDTPGEKRLIGYIVPLSGNTLTSEHLRAYLRSKVPDYMVPSAFVLLETMPVTPNGKIDRRALPRPASDNAAGTSQKGLSPRNTTEERLLAIFSEVLNTTVTSVNDNFFDFGGHSLLAVKLMRSIEREFGTRLPLARLFASPTVANLAIDLSVNAQLPTHWNSLIPIQPRKNKPTLFLVHGAGGNLLLYRELAQALGDDISVYGFQSVGLDRKARPLTSVKEMAARYVEELRAFQPKGPYHLAGYCMGGAVSYEMARLLRSQNQRIGVVGLLDTYNLSEVKNDKAQAGQFSFLRQRIGFHFDNLTHLGAKDAVGYITEKLRMARESGLGKIASRLEHLKNAMNGTVEEVGAEQFIQEINHEAAWDYVPEPTDIAITAFRPQKNYDIFSDPKMGWSSAVGANIEVVETFANPHAMLIEPHVLPIAQHLKARVLAFASSAAATKTK